MKKPEASGIAPGLEVTQALWGCPVRSSNLTLHEIDTAERALGLLADLRQRYALSEAVTVGDLAHRARVLELATVRAQLELDGLLDRLACRPGVGA